MAENSKPAPLGIVAGFDRMFELTHTGKAEYPTTCLLAPIASCKAGRPAASRKRSK